MLDNAWPLAGLLDADAITVVTRTLALSLDFPILECTQQDGADEGERHTDGKHIQLHGKVHAILLAVQSGKSIRKLAPSEAVNVLRRKRFPEAGSENDPGNLINLLNLNEIFYSHCNE